MRLPHFAIVTAAVLLTALAAAAAGYGLGRSSSPKEPVVRTALGQSDHPRGAKGRSLALTRTVIKPGAKLPLHHHEGTQVAYIQKGTVTYSVEHGHAKVREGAVGEGARVVRDIKAGDTARIHPGQWLIEQPSDFHHAANQGSKRVVVFQATLLKTGAPPATPVGD